MVLIDVSKFWCVKMGPAILAAPSIIKERKKLKKIVKNFKKYEPSYVGYV